MTKDTPSLADERMPTRMAFFLEILASMGGQSDASDYKWNWLNAFCAEHEGQEPDTFNEAVNRGFTTVSHDSSTDESTVYLTDAGRNSIETRPTEARTGGDASLSAQQALDSVTHPLRIAIEQAIAWFDEYSESHAHKAAEAVGVDDIEAEARKAKARTNAERASYLRAALSHPTPADDARRTLAEQIALDRAAYEAMPEAERGNYARELQAIFNNPGVTFQPPAALTASGDARERAPKAVRELFDIVGNQAWEPRGGRKTQQIVALMEDGWLRPCVMQSMFEKRNTGVEWTPAAHALLDTPPAGDGGGV